MAEAEAEAAAGGDNMEAEAALADPLLLLTMNLLRVALHNISYVRGLFPENCFIDKSIPEIGMKFKMLVHMDHESRRFIEWLEKGVSDALQKKYLKTLLFCICEEGEIIEEYAFSFRYPTLYNEDISMNVNLTGSGEKSTTFKSNAGEVTPHRMRIIACKLIRTLVSLMSTLEELPYQRTIQMKLLYYDADTPGDYEPPLFECCADAAGNNKPLRIEARSANMKDLLLALKPENYDDPAFGCSANSSVNNKPLKMEVGSTNSKDIVLASKINTEDGNTSLITDYKHYEVLSLCEARLVRKFELCCVSKRRPVFLLDSGASFHICNNKAYMKNLKPIPEEKQRMLDGINGEVYVAKEMGSVAFENINVSQVMFIPELDFNVFSVGQFDQQGLLVLLTGGLFMILDVDNAIVIGEGYRHTTNNDYVVKGINWVQPDTEETSDVNHPEIEPDKEWIIDSCAACHLTFKKELLINIRTCKEEYQTPRGKIWSTHSGDVKIENLTLSKVQYSPKATRNLISVPSLEAEGHRFAFYQSKCGIVLKSTFRQCGSGVRDPRDNLYYLTELNPKKDITVVASAATTSTKRKWHS